LQAKEFTQSQQFKPHIFGPLCNAAKVILGSLVAKQWNTLSSPTDCKLELEQIVYYIHNLQFY
jgi:hypothetical protein